MCRSSLKILMLTQFLDPTRGGGESMFYQIASELSKRGHKISIIKHKIIGKEYTYNNNNIKVIEVYPAIEHKGRLPASFLQNFLYIINCVRSGLKIIKSEKVHVIHANNYSPVFAGWLISKLTHRPLVVTIHDVASLHGVDFWKKWMRQFGGFSYLKSVIGYIAELLTIRLAKNIHTVSTTSKNDILKLFPWKRKHNLCVITNGISLEYYDIPDIDEIRYEDEIAFIGRLVFYKNLDVVLKAVSIVPRNNFKLTVLGNGPMRNHWEKLAIEYGVSKKVNFRGYVSHGEKLKVLRRVSALVLPSIFEGFGIVILEAWAFKKPVIVADVSPLNEIVEHGRDGFVADPYNPEEWAKYIKMLLEDRDLARKIGENGYRKLIDQYTVEKTVNKFEQLYKEVVK